MRCYDYTEVLTVEITEKQQQKTKTEEVTTKVKTETNQKKFFVVKRKSGINK